ncbi:HAD family phosphatase [Gilvimarinus sp. SDUM040013]|uniref:HAD family phosphatase n=1 Tax=Gilvimarinus gilvus TaxID=3058038 RepID=A0ABU4S1T4_9GAMM|nr:HAD family phosphatase [Gilvimarinus sp. SDUM040013]MDO3386113.1 HAD family phosphatase [Gilvimarinus sp. SDUM040013]MDX6850346.1 HAD family phosphatase [Gilvimarinus sp. SDUM040013]
MVIFDCDGVLVDTETLSANVLRGCLTPLGVEMSVADVLALFCGKSISVCAEQVSNLLREMEPYKSWSKARLESFTADFWCRVQQETLLAFDSGVKPIAGIKPLLDALKLKQIPFCVASNGRHEKMQLSLTQAELIEFFPRENRFSATDVAVGKPAPDLFLLAARTKGVDVRECVVVEDSPSGVEAAVRAGIRVLGYNSHDPHSATACSMRQLGATMITSMDEVIDQI